jgi:hypothetical protein
MPPLTDFFVVTRSLFGFYRLDFYALSLAVHLLVREVQGSTSRFSFEVDPPSKVYLSSTWAASPTRMRT